MNKDDRIFTVRATPHQWECLHQAIVSEKYGALRHEPLVARLEGLGYVTVMHAAHGFVWLYPTEAGRAAWARYQAISRGETTP